MTHKEDDEIKTSTTQNDMDKDKSTPQKDVRNESNDEGEVESLKPSSEQKQITGTEPGKLEYYSKEYLIEKVTNLEQELKSQSEELKKIKDDAKNWKDKFMRMQAEFENAQKRWEKTRKNLRLEYTASVLKSFLPLYDSFKKALSDDGENMKILKGFYDQFMSILKSHKAESMNVQVNELFDYSTQEALTSIEKPDLPKNTILEVVQDGWKLEDEVLRYAKVIISKEPKPPEPETKPKEEKEAEMEEKQEGHEKQEKVDKDQEKETKSS